MSTTLKISLMLTLLLSPLAHAIDTAPRKTLAPFASEQALTAYLDKLLAQQEQIQRLRRAEIQPMAKPAPQPAPMPVAEASPAKSSAVAGSVAAADESVTNTQTVGVDEGGIVKVHGKHLVMLRRGKLFTVNVERQALKPVASLDAFAPGSDPSGSWYD